MREIAAILSIIVLFMSMYVLLKAWEAIDQAKQVMYLVYDWLEELESKRGNGSKDEQRSEATTC